LPLTWSEMPCEMHLIQGLSANKKVIKATALA